VEVGYLSHALRIVPVEPNEHFLLNNEDAHTGLDWSSDAIHEHVIPQQPRLTLVHYRRMPSTSNTTFLFGVVCSPFDSITAHALVTKEHLAKLHARVEA
jgi:hypothetical protein